MRWPDAFCALHPTAAAWVEISGLSRATGDWEGVARALTHAVELAPREDRLHYQLGLALLRLERPGPARDAFARAVELNPERGIHRTLLERATQEAEARNAPP